MPKAGATTKVNKNKSPKYVNNDLLYHTKKKKHPKKHSLLKPLDSIYIATKRDGYMYANKL